MLKRLLLCLFLLVAALPAWATDYTDIWYNPTEAGWGANIVQSDDFMFVTFFIYGPDNKPTWYTAELTLDAGKNYTGKLYATTGTFYGAPWRTVDRTEVGTAAFQPTSPSTGRLIYTVTTPPALAATVTKAIQRQTLTRITLGGSYIGAQSGTYSGCNNAATNGPYTDNFSLEVVQSGGVNLTMTFSYQSFTCTLSGTLTQFGQLYTIPTTTYACSDGLNTNASIGELKATNLGIEGHFSAPVVGGGCREDATFSAVLR